MTQHPATSGSAGSAESMTQYLTCGLAGETFALPILSVQEIRGWEPVVRTPRAPAHLLGILNLRGTVVPIMNLRVRLGMTEAERTSTSVIIVVSVKTAPKSMTMGVLVDAVSDVVSFSPEEIRGTPDACGTLDTHFVCGIAHADNHLVMILDVLKLVGDSAVSAVQAVA